MLFEGSRLGLAVGRLQWKVQGLLLGNQEGLMGLDMGKLAGINRMLVSVGDRGCRCGCECELLATNVKQFIRSGTFMITV